MAASLAPTISSTPAPPSGSNHEREAKLSMSPSTGVSTPASPMKGGSILSIKKEETVVNEKPAKRERRRDRKSKPKPKPKKRETAQCVGYYIDALDKKMLWGEARIIQCNLSTQKIKVHFVGWSKNYDLWTDPMSITAHGHYAPITRNDKSVKSWDGDMHLFDDMLGSVEETAATPVSDPTKAEPSAAAKKKARGNKKVFSEEKEPSATRVIARHSEKAAQKSDRVGFKRESVEHKLSNGGSVAANEHNLEQTRNSKPIAKERKGKELTKEKQELTRNPKRQKRESARPATTAVSTPTTPSLKKKKTRSADELPLFRDLELDDGTLLDFSAQREEARAEREAMQSFLNKCALIWKKQLSTLSVQ